MSTARVKETNQFQNQPNTSVFLNKQSNNIKLSKAVLSSRRLAKSEIFTSEINQIKRVNLSKDGVSLSQASQRQISRNPKSRKQSNSNSFIWNDNDFAEYSHYNAEESKLISRNPKSLLNKSNRARNKSTNSIKQHPRFKMIDSHPDNEDKEILPVKEFKPRMSLKYNHDYIDTYIKHERRQSTLLNLKHNSKNTDIVLQESNIFEEHLNQKKTSHINESQEAKIAENRENK